MAWNTGIMHIIYKGKGDASDLINYRGITVNNASSKIFTSILNSRLTEIVEEANILGNIQQGGRPNKRTTDSLFLLRTIIEKALTSTVPKERAIALAFIDLSKAYDHVSHERLWNKLLALGFQTKVVNLLRSLYRESTVRVMVNGHLSKEVVYERGIKQGCVLSPLLFILYLSELGYILEKNPNGIQLAGQRIAGLLYIDDLVLIGKSVRDVTALLEQVQGVLKEVDMKINCSKSKIVTAKEVVEDIPLKSVAKETEGHIQQVAAYKYLGVEMQADSIAGIFKAAAKKSKQKMKAHASTILGLAKNDSEPVKHALKLWEAVAIPAATYGMEVIRLTKGDIKELESIQSTFIAHLLGQRKTVSHAALRSETGIQPVEKLIEKKKINHWRHLHLSKNVWVKAAYQECFKTNNETYRETKAPMSYAKEIEAIKQKLGKEVNPDIKGATYKKEINKLLSEAYNKIDNEKLLGMREHSLRAYPRLNTTCIPRPHLAGRKGYKVITSFRLGDAGLGNKGPNPVVSCPICSKGRNNEAHLVLECDKVQTIREYYAQFINISKYCQNDGASENLDSKLKVFLSDPKENFNQQAGFLTQLQEKHGEWLNNQQVPLPVNDLTEECPKCNFKSKSRTGIKIHKSKVHK